MGKASCRPTREARQQHKAKVRAARRQWRAQQTAAGVRQPQPVSASNALCGYATVEAEQAAREAAVAAQLPVYRELLPKLLEDLGRIPDPRQPKKCKHKLTVVLLYGLLSFVFQMASRREANRTLSRPAFLATLQAFFPELESLPHADTLNRLLARIEVQELEVAQVEVIRRLIRNKKFRRYLVEQCYPIAIDGTQKLVRAGQWWDEDWLERRRETAEGEQVQQYVYVLEANLVFPNGLTLPLLSEFLSYGEADPDDHKQDCELKAFHRLAERLKRYFPRLPILLLLDGLYPNGPLMARCRRYGWQYLIVLPDKCLPSVWEEVTALRPRLAKNRKQQQWQGRQQCFWWVNHMTYSYDHDQHTLPVHVVGCEETWREVDPDSGELITKQSRHVWISSHPLRHDNVHERGNLGARRRWGIELSIQIEKCHGYHYEHLFSQDWKALKGFHYLLRLAHLFNALAQGTRRVAQQVRTLGVQAFLRVVRETCANRWLRYEWIQQLRATPFQLRLE